MAVVKVNINGKKISKEIAIAIDFASRNWSNKTQYELFYLDILSASRKKNKKTSINRYKPTVA